MQNSKEYEQSDTPHDSKSSLNRPRQEWTHSYASISVLEHAQCSEVE